MGAGVGALSVTFVSTRTLVVSTVAVRVKLLLKALPL
jgi:hypothetical protein